jgi:HEAT repeat protein
MDAQSTIAEARRMIAASDLEGARDLLLEAGYVRQLDPHVQKAFVELIPMSPPPDGLLEQLTDADPNIRHAAAKAIRRAAMKEWHVDRKPWLADPRLHDSLLERIERDDDPAVVEEAAGAIAFNIPRYLADLRAFEPLRRLLGSSRKTTRFHAVFGLGFLHTPERFQALIPMLNDRVENVRRQAAGAIGEATVGPQLDPADVQALRPILPSLLDHSDPKIREVAAAALGRIGMREALPDVERALAKEKDKRAKQALEMAAASLRKAPQ